MEEEGNNTLFSPSKGDCYVTVLEKDCYNGDLALMAMNSASLTGGHNMMNMGEGKGIIFVDRIARYWLGLVDDKYVEISVGHTCRGVEPMLKSLKVAPKTKKAAPLSALLATMQSPENTRWLVSGQLADNLPAVEPAETTGEMPDFAALVDPAAPAPQERTIPEGWRTTNIGQWTIYDKPDKKVWVAIGLYPIKKGESAQREAYFVELARKVKGINITSGEDTVDFFTREGAIGTVESKDANTVMELFYPEDDANVSELRMELQ